MKRFLQAVLGSTLVLLPACSEQALTNPESTVRAPDLAEALFVLAIKIPDDEFREADANVNGRVCAKDTPSGGIVLVDDNLQTPSQPCPPAFGIYGKSELVPIGGVKEGDDNRNGMVCAKETGNGGIIIRDDNPATPSQPCPPAFSIVGAVKDPTPKVNEKDLHEADANRNALVCLKQNATGNFIINDDNLETPSQPCAPAFLSLSLGTIIIREDR